MSDNPAIQQYLLKARNLARHDKQPAGWRIPGF